jgi:hypothetical protein
MAPGTLFSSLSEDEKARWLRRRSAAAYQKGEIFVARGEIWPYLFLVH